MNSISNRNDKVAFMKVSDTTPVTYTRMRGFTEFSQNKNPIEYQRRYIDEKTQRNDVVGYSPSVSYSFDRYSDEAVHTKLAGIADNEIVGSNACVSIVVVDMTDSNNYKPAILRQWSVIPDSEGTDNDAYTYSGNLKANGDITAGYATTSDNWSTCSFVTSIPNNNNTNE